MHDTGTDIRFDPYQNTVIDTTGGVIILNPTRTDMPIKNILLHEIAKNIGGQNTQNYVINKLKKDGTYEQRKNELLATGEFDEANVNNEIVAQELDKILSNEEMLKELANKDTNLFNDIKEKIDFLTSKLTNGKNTKDAYYLNALYNNFQRDYGISTTPNKDYVSEIKPKEDKSTIVEEKPLENAKNEVVEENKIYDNLTDSIIKETNSEKGDAHSDFFTDRTTDFDKNQGTTSDGKSFVLRIKKGDNEAKVSLTENDSKIWIDEL